MLRLKTRLNIRSRVVARCEKHLRYNPEKDGRGGIRGACSRCEYLYAIYATQQVMLNAARDFQQMTQTFEQIKPKVARAMVAQ